jgi:lysophospholipid acyltransferase (LPLAT)-like uncharacterized protein
MRAKDTVKDFCYRLIFPRAGLLGVKLISRTYRYRLVDTEMKKRRSMRTAQWSMRPGTSGSSRASPCLPPAKPIAIMISQSRDGEMIARVVDILGWRPVRGSSSKGGVTCPQKLRRLTKQGFRVGHIVDGPQGPFRGGQAGPAHHRPVCRCPIVPVITSAQRRWVFNSWDRFMVPKPFSRVIVRFAPPITVPAGWMPSHSKPCDGCRKTN